MNKAECGLGLELLELAMIEMGRFLEQGGKLAIQYSQQGELLLSENGRPRVMLDMTHSDILPLLVSREKQNDKFRSAGGTFLIMNDDYVLDMTNSPLLYELVRNNRRRKPSGQQTKRKKL